MELTRAAAITATLSLVAGHGQAATLDNVRAKDQLTCVISPELSGFSAPDAAGRWEGFDVDFCLAVAVAALGDGEKVRLVPATSKNRFTLLSAGEGDILFRHTTETMSRDADQKLTFLPVNYYDGQGFVIHKDLGSPAPGN